MILAIIPTAEWLLLFGLFRRVGQRWRSAVLNASLVWGVLVVLFTETLSLPRILNRGTMAGAWILAAAATGALLYRWRTRATAPGKPEEDLASNVPLIMGMGFLAALVGVTALVAPPNTVDVMDYHMPRVVYWLENGSVAPYPTDAARQLYMTPGAEFVVLQFQALAGSDRFANMIQWMSLLGAAIGVSVIAKYLGSGPGGQTLAAVLSVTIPQGLLVASGAKNDYVLAFWLTVSAVCLFRLRRNPTLWNATAAGGALGLAVVTKSTGVIFAAPLALCCVLSWDRKERGRLVRRMPLLLGAALLLNVGPVVRNYAVYGRATGPATEGGGCSYLNQSFSPGAMWSGVVRNVALHLTTPVPQVNQFFQKTAENAIRAVGGDPNAPETTWCGTRFEIPHFAFHEIYLGNTLHFLLILAALYLLIESRKLRSSRGLVAYCSGLAAAFLAFCIALTWQPWHTRLHLPLFVLWAPAIAVILTTALPAAAWRGLAVLMLMISVPIAVKNEIRPLLDANANIFSVPRDEQYFTDRRSLQASYTAAAESVRGSGCKQIGLDPSGATYEYAFLALLRAGQGGMIVRPVGVTGPANKFDRVNKSFQPCAVICADCANETSKYQEYASFGSGSVFGRVVVFGGAGSQAAANNSRANEWQFRTTEAPGDAPLIYVDQSLQGQIGLDPALAKTPWAVENLGGSEQGFLWIGQGPDEGLEFGVWSRAARTVRLGFEVSPGPSVDTPGRSVSLLQDGTPVAERSTFQGEVSLPFRVTLRRGRNLMRFFSLDAPNKKVLANGDTRNLIIGLRKIRIEQDSGAAGK